MDFLNNIEINNNDINNYMIEEEGINFELTNEFKNYLSTNIFLNTDFYN